MIKKIFVSAVLLLTAFGTAVAADLSVNTLTDGTVIRVKGSPVKYLIRGGVKMKIKDSFTWKELGFAAKDIVDLSFSDVKKIPNGEVLKMSKPKIKGMIDMHEHYRAGGDMEKYLKVARSLGIAKTLFVPTGNGPDNAGFEKHQKALLEMQVKYPDEVIAFCTVDEAKEEAPAILEECLKDGGKGLKLMTGHPSFYDVPLNSDIMQKLFEVAREHDVPVLIHVSIMSIPTAEAEFKDLLDKVPGVTVNYAHYCSSIYAGINLDKCASFLDKYPDLYIDLSMGGGIERYFQYTTEDMPRIRDFILKYQDRVLVGTDLILAPKPSPTANAAWVRARMMCDYSLHQEKLYRCPIMNNKGKYTLLPGFELPDDVLKKIYIENPKKFLKMD